MRAALVLNARGTARAMPHSRCIPIKQPARFLARPRPAAARRTAIQAYYGAEAADQVDVTFVLQRKVLFGQNVLLCGNVPELGSWDLDQAARMEWSEGNNGEHHWTATVSLPAGSEVEYKFVIEDKHHPPLWESCWNRKLRVDAGNTHLYGYWNQPMEEETHPQGSPVVVNSGNGANGAYAYDSASNGNGQVTSWSDSRVPSPSPLNGAGLSPEQRAFLERKAAEARGASQNPSRITGSSPSPARLSPEQQAFLERKRREASTSPTPAPNRGRSPAPSRGRSPAPSRAAALPAPRGLSPDQLAFLERKQREASTSAADGPSPAPPARPAAAAPASRGLSPEQMAFLERKQQTSASPAPTPTRGRSPAPSPGRNSAPSSSAASSRGLSPEQLAFLERKRQTSTSPAPATTRGRSPAPSRNGAASIPSASASLSAEQKAFLERKRQESTSPAPAAATVSPQSRGLSPEQQAFMERKRQASSSPTPASTRGRSPASSRNGSSASTRGLSPEQLAFLERKQRDTSFSPAPSSNGRSAGQSPVPAGLSSEQMAFMRRAGKL